MQEINGIDQSWRTFLQGSEKKERVAMNSLLSIFFLCELLVSIWSCAISGIICDPSQQSSICYCGSCDCQGCEECGDSGEERLNT